MKKISKVQTEIYNPISFDQFEEFKDEVRDMLFNFKSDIMTGIDKVVKRLDDIDANIAIQGNDTEELKSRVAALEHRKN